MVEYLKDLYENVVTFDLIYIIITLLSLIKCSRKGFVLSILEAAKWLLAYVITLILFPRIKPYVNDVIDNEYILDIESLIHLEEKTNYFNDIISEDKATICIIGSIHLQNNIYRSFQDFTINNLSIDEEQKIIQNWVLSLRTSSEGSIKIYHWGHAEKTYLENMIQKYPDIKFPNIQLIDLLNYFREEPIIIKGCFNFGLKSVAKSMYKHKFISTTWEDTDNGLDAMIKFKEICEYNKNKLHL